MMPELLQSLMLQSGYNAALVSIGAMILGAVAGSVGVFLFLRKRALISDAISHASLPGIGIAFLVMVAFGGDGRNLMGLLLGASLSAALGLIIVEWMTHKTRLPEDAAIGAVLSVFFGFGIVILTLIQSMNVGRQAGLQGFLLGSTAGMLFEDALVIAISGLLAGGALWVFRRPMTLVVFDPEYARALGYPVRMIDRVMMLLALAIAVIGLKVVGLILSVALLIIPAVTARFWTQRSEYMVLIAALVGAFSSYMGAALSASLPKVPTGAMIIVVCFTIFMLSLLFAPQRGVIAGSIQSMRVRKKLRVGGG